MHPVGGRRSVEDVIVAEDFTFAASSVMGDDVTGLGFPTCDAVDALALVANQKGATVAQVALTWLLAQPGVTSIIIGANKMEQLEDNLKASALQLSPEELEQLSLTTAPAPLYPEWMIERQNQGRQRPQANKNKDEEISGAAAAR